MSVAEITSESTHDDIVQAVDDIVKARGERETEAKSDAVKIAEDRDETSVVEVNSGNEDTAVEDGEKAESDGQDLDWLDDNLKKEIAAYGISEEELADFTSREELERAMRLFDKTALEAGRKAQPKRDETGKFQKEEDAEPVSSSYEIKLDRDLYDEDLVNELTSMRDHYETRVAALERRQAENDAKAESQLFDGIVDGLGHADLFGTSGKESPKQLERRQSLYEAAKAQVIGMKVMGRDVQMDQSLVQRVARMAFAEDFSKKDLKAATRKITKQSNGRMGGGATRPSDPAESVREEFRRRYKELEGA